jgi:hypothetical protein
MTDPTLVSRPLIPFLQNWLAANSQQIASAADAVGLKPTLIVGGAVQEASTIIKETQTVIDNGQILTGVTQRSVDVILDHLVVNRFSSAEIASDYTSRLNDIITTPAKPVESIDVLQNQLSKAFEPTKNDIGYANINLGTAIYYLNRYLADPSAYLADPARASSDPLQLQQYANNYAKLAADIIDPNGNATWAISALIAKQGFNDFNARYGATFTNASEDQQAALLTTFYKQGEFVALGQPATFNGTNAGAGSGGQMVLDNFGTIKNIVSANAADPHTPAEVIAADFSELDALIVASNAGWVSEVKDSTGTEAWSSQINAFDLNDVLQLQQQVLRAGGNFLKIYDPNNTHPYTELDIAEDATGKVTAAQLKLDGQPNTPADFSAVGQVLGSALGRALAPNNQFVQLAAGTVIGAVGQKLAQAFAASLTTDGATFDFSRTFADFNVSIAGAGASSVASFLVAELGTALHLDGFGGQLFNASAGGFAGSVASQVATKMAAGASFDVAIGTLNFASAATNAAYGVSALFGSFLAHEFVPAQTHEGAAGGQLLGAVGSAIGISAALSGALGTVLGFIVPGLGSLIGTILGTLIGDAVGNVPHPAAVDLIDQHGYLYAATHYQVSASDGGDYSTPDQLAVPALAIINAYLGAVKGAALDHSKQVTLGYQANPVFYIDGVPGHPAIGTSLSPNAAVQDAALAVLQNTEVIGGDLLMKRAHQNSSSNHSPAPAPVDPNSNGDPGPTGSAVVVSAAEQLAVMSGDLSVAQDYENYLNNREAINALMAANPNSAFTAGWIATFARVNELGLNHVNASDFLGGLVGYLDSVNKAGLGAEAANATVRQSGSSIIVEVHVANGVDVPGSLAAFADQTNVSSDATSQTVQLVFNNGLGANSGLGAASYRLLGAGQVSGDAGNDLWFGSDSASSFNATASANAILVGGASNDTLSSGNGWDFLDGGAGNDTLASAAATTSCAAARAMTRSMADWATTAMCSRAATARTP